MDGRSIIDLLKREFSEDVVLRLSNIIKAVSYTHLDVYKRQEEGKVRGEGIKGKEDVEEEKKKKRKENKKKE